MKFNMLRLDEKSFSPQKCYSPSNFLQLHLLLTFSCFSNPNLLNHFLQSLALIRTPFYSRVDCYGNYNICNIWPFSYKNIHLFAFKFKFSKLQRYINATDVSAKMLKLILNDEISKGVYIGTIIVPKIFWKASVKNEQLVSRNWGS